MRNEATLNALARELERNCGDELAAARTVGVSLQFVRQWRKDDKIVDERLIEAERFGTMGLVSAAIQRGVHGVDEDVYFKGEVVGQKRVYSDGLLQTLLKAKVDDFKKDGGEGGVHVNVNVANVMPRATSYEQWLEMKTKTLDKPSPSLPAPDEREAALGALSRVMCEPAEVIEAEFTAVRAPAFGGIVL